MPVATGPLAGATGPRPNGSGGKLPPVAAHKPPARQNLRFTFGFKKMSRKEKKKHHSHSAQQNNVVAPKDNKSFRVNSKEK